MRHATHHAARAAAALLGVTLLAQAHLALALNGRTTIVLHAVDAPFVPCDAAAAVDCESVRPTIDVSGMQSPAIVMLLRNDDVVAGIQAAFSIPESWVFVFAMWDCQQRQVVGHYPRPPWGPREGTIATVFDAVFGGRLVEAT